MGPERSTRGRRPYEVELVRHVHPLMMKRIPDTTVRVEVPCGGGREDLVVEQHARRRIRVFEFSVLRVGVSKAMQLLRYVHDLRVTHRDRTIIPHLVAMSFEGESSSRTIEVDRERIHFANWHDFLRDLVRSDLP